MPDFLPPEAFIFLYEKEKFLTLKEGKIEIWTSDGKLLTDFQGQTLCTRMDLNGDAANPDDAAQQPGTTNYIVSVSQSKRYLFAYQLLQIETAKQPSENPEDSQASKTSPMSLINVIDI